MIQLEKGKVYQWLMGACYLEVKYIGKSTDTITKEGELFPVQISTLCGTRYGKGLVFQFTGSKSYTEIGYNTLMEAVSEIEILHVVALSSFSVKGQLNPHSYNMRYLKDNWYCFKCTDKGYVCTSTEGVKPLGEKQFNNRFK